MFKVTIRQLEEPHLGQEASVVVFCLTLLVSDINLDFVLL